MQMEGIHFIEDWKVGFKAFSTDTKKFDKLLEETPDGILFHGIVDGNEVLIEFGEITDEYVRSKM